VLETVVVCNGCTDGTAQVARAIGLPIRVIEIEEASKVAALRTADHVAESFPRLYLDADVVLSGRSAQAVLQRLATGDHVLAARPPLRYDTDDCSAYVRRYYATRMQVPTLLNRLWGAGVYGLSETGRARFDDWPRQVADDLFIDSLFLDQEITVIDTEPVVVRTPRTTRDLLAVLRRAASAKSAAARGRDADGRELPLRQPLGSTLGGLAGVVVRGQAGVLDVLVYAGFAVCGRIRRRAPVATVWERDESSRGPT
jgi:glycosyltransferase involved in cell wall biosynthesis